MSVDYPHHTYIIEQPFGGYGRAYQAVCERCGVLIHVNDRQAAEAEAKLHGVTRNWTAGPRTPLSADEAADAAHDAKMRQRKIEAELA